MSHFCCNTFHKGVSPQETQEEIDEHFQHWISSVSNSCWLGLLETQFLPAKRCSFKSQESGLPAALYVCVRLLGLCGSCKVVRSFPSVMMLTRLLSIWLSRWSGLLSH